MNLLLIVYDVDFDEDVMNVISASGATGYTKWDRVLGKGKNSDPKLDDSVWPGFNCAIITAVEDEKESALFDTLKDLLKQMEGKGLKVFSWPLGRVI